MNYVHAWCNTLTRNYQVLKVIRYLLILSNLNKIWNSHFRLHTCTLPYIYARAHSAVTTCTSGPDNVFWYCPWEIQDCQRGISIFAGYRTKFQAWPGRLMTSAPSYAEGGNRNASTPSIKGGWIRPIDGFGAGVDQSTNSAFKASGHSYSTDPIRSRCSFRQ